jgi:ABC-type multidrug transport system fused ATPase/permease subunit
MISPTSLPGVLWRVYRLLSPSERKKSAVLLASIFLNSIVEILGLAVIVPVIGLVVQPETIATNPWLNRAFTAVHPLGIDTPARFLIALCVLMILAFLFKALFGLAANLFQTRFSFAVAHRLSGDMWTHHFASSLERMRTNDSGRILAEINAWPIEFASRFMVGGLLILSEVTVIAILAGGLLVYNPTVFLSITALLVLGSFLIRTATRRRLAIYSGIRQHLEPHTTTLVTDAVRGFLEVITFRAADAVRDAYLSERWKVFRMNSNTAVLSMAPAKLYEVLAVVAVAGSIIIALLQGTPEAGFLQLLTFMAISAYRIMPSMSRLNSAAIGIRGQMHVLETMEHGAEQGRLIAAKRSGAGCSQALVPDSPIDIRLSGLTLGYASRPEPVLEDLQYAFAAGQMHAIVGPSGSGKSTLISALLGLHHPAGGGVQVVQRDGEARVLGDDLPLSEWILHVGYLSQQPFLFQGTVRENLTLRVRGAQIDEVAVHQLIRILRLEECLGSSPLDFILQEGGSNLSGGQQQRLALLRALQLHRPVLILDEATSALDAELRDVVFALLRDRASLGCNVILVTHDRELADRCDDVFELNQTAMA